MAVGRTLLSLQKAIIGLAVAAAISSILLAILCLPEPDRNPASPEFGKGQWDWATVTLVSALLLGGAILTSISTTRRIMIALLLLMGGVGILNRAVSSSTRDSDGNSD